MNKTSVLVLSIVALIAGCEHVTPNYDARFGDAVREAKRAMTIDPDAGKKPDMVMGLDGPSSRESITRYQESFKEPPPVANVINIGGGIGNGNQGSGR